MCLYTPTLGGKGIKGCEMVWLCGRLQAKISACSDAAALNNIKLKQIKSASDHVTMRTRPETDPEVNRGSMISQG